MDGLIVCVSVSHRNTRKVADAMADVLDACVVEPEEVDDAMLEASDLAGASTCSVRSRVEGGTPGCRSGSSEG